MLVQRTAHKTENDRGARATVVTALLNSAPLFRKLCISLKTKTNWHKNLVKFTSNLTNQFNAHSSHVYKCNTAFTSNTSSWLCGHPFCDSVIWGEESSYVLGLLFLELFRTAGMRKNSTKACPPPPKKSDWCFLYILLGIKTFGCSTNFHTAKCGTFDFRFPPWCK
jgi:hypothetical protein